MLLWLPCRLCAVASPRHKLALILRNEYRHRPFARCGSGKLNECDLARCRARLGASGSMVLFRKNHRGSEWELRLAETCLSLSLMPHLSGAGTEGAVCPGSIGLSGHGIMAETPAVHNSAQKRFKRFKRHTANRRQKMIKTDLTSEVPSR